MLGLSVRNGGIMIRNPIATADRVYTTLRAASSFIVSVKVPPRSIAKWNLTSLERLLASDDDILAGE